MTPELAIARNLVKLAIASSPSRNTRFSRTEISNAVRLVAQHEHA